MQPSATRHRAAVAPSRTGHVLLSGAVWVLFAVLVFRFANLWARSFSGMSLPLLLLGSIGFTAAFTLFSLLHAGSTLGWRRTLAFLVISVVVSWCFETVGIATGLVYGAYHYGSRLGPKLGVVPVIIPLAWFMMVYASWVVARLLLGGEGASGWSGIAARTAVASMTMTAWDTVMDPGKALSGAWTWEDGGAYFGVPLHNFAGWLATTATIYALVEIAFRFLPTAPGRSVGRLSAGLPALVYTLVAVDAVLRPGLPELRVVAMFGMGFIALLAVIRLALSRGEPAADGITTGRHPAPARS